MQQLCTSIIYVFTYKKMLHCSFLHNGLKTYTWIDLIYNYIQGSYFHVVQQCSLMFQVWINNSDFLYINGEKYLKEQTALIFLTVKKISRINKNHYYWSEDVLTWRIFDRSCPQFGDTRLHSPRRGSRRTPRGPHTGHSAWTGTQWWEFLKRNTLLVKYCVVLGFY